MLPPALALRREDAALDEALDRLGSQAEVRRALTDFNDRVRRILYTTHGGPPVTTSPRDVDEEVRRWVARREERRARLRARREAGGVPEETGRQTRRRWFRPRDRSGPSQG